MKRLLCAAFFVALLSGIIMCPAGYCSDGPVFLSDFSSFVWSKAERSVTKNNSYTTYTYFIPSTVSGAIDEYVEHLTRDYGMKRIALSEDSDGNFLAAFSIADSESKGFRIEIGGETVRGCHVLMQAMKKTDTEHRSMLVMYVCRGIEVHKNAARSILVPSPAPAATQPGAVTPAPVITDSPEPTFYCAYCQNNRKVRCKTCDGDGTVSRSGYVAGYNGVGTGGYVTWEEPCPIKQCVDGYIDCPYCSNR